MQALCDCDGNGMHIGIHFTSKHYMNLKITNILPALCLGFQVNNTAFVIFSSASISQTGTSLLLSNVDSYAREYHRAMCASRVAHELVSGPYQ